MELCGSLLLFLALPPEVGPEGGACGDEGDPVAADAVMFFQLSVFVAWNVALFKPAC